MSEVLKKLLEITEDGTGVVGHPSRRILREAATREVYDLATTVANTMGQLESEIQNMPKLTRAIAKSRQEIVNSINADESWLMRKLGFKDKNQSLSNAIIEAEMLRLAALNSMDAVKLTIIKDFNKATRLDDPEVIRWNVVPDSRTPSRAGLAGSARRAPFSEISGLNYEIYARSSTMMIIGPQPTGILYDVSFTAPGWASGPIMVYQVPVGNFYLVRIDDDGDPAPLQKSDKIAALGVRDTTPAELSKTISELITAERKNRGRGSSLNLQQIVSDHYKVPSDEQGFIESLARKVFNRARIGSVDKFYNSTELLGDLKNLTLDNFKKNYLLLKDKTLPGSGDRPIDEIDAVIAGGLTSLAVALGMRPPTSPAAPGAPTVSTPSAPISGGGGSVSTGGSGGGGGRTTRATPLNRSLRNFLQNNTEIVKGADSAEKQRNLQSLLNTIDTDGLRRELNRAVGPTVVFTEGNIDRWSELAGIPKEKLND